MNGEQELFCSTLSECHASGVVFQYDLSAANDVIHAGHHLSYDGLCLATTGGHSLLQAAEQIVVLEQGQVREVGTHDELVKRNGVYADLVSSTSLSLSTSV